MPPMPSQDYVFNRIINSIDKDELSISKAFSLFSIKDDSRYLELIHLFKYNGHRGIGFELGRELGQFIKYNTEIDYDFIVPVPIHSARMRERGFNQSDVIAHALSRELAVPMKTELIFRIKYTKTQTLLSKDERKKNVENIFKPKKGFDCYSIKNILLVDDVLTTGSTINSAANCLLQMGAKRIDCASLAVA
ncbi:MAG: ComF family protein [Ignavibacteria bacterium]|nr:ComF family protein [Ignavibacteria bacterium]